jgi:hypothetical protein
MPTFYDDCLDRLQSFYNLDDVADITVKNNFTIYTLPRSDRDYKFIASFFEFHSCNYNLKKIKQLSTLIDFYYYVSDLEKEKKDANKSLQIAIPISQYSHVPRATVKFYLGDTLSFSFSRESDDHVVEFILYQNSFFKSDCLIDYVSFENLYSGILVKTREFLENDMTFKKLLSLSKKTVIDIQKERLVNKDLMHITPDDFAMYFFNFGVEPKRLFDSLPLVFSKQLVSQVKIIEGLLRFDSCLLYNMQRYELFFNLIRPTKHFKVEDNLYSIMVVYYDDVPCTIGLYFSLTNPDIGYMEVNHHTQDLVSLSGYENIYNHLFEKVKSRFTKRLNIPSSELTDHSLLLYKMMSI